MTITEFVQTAAVVLPIASTVCSALSAAIPDARLGALAKFVNLLALNVGKARNDPAVQGVDSQDAPQAPIAGKDAQG